MKWWKFLSCDVGSVLSIVFIRLGGDQIEAITDMFLQAEMILRASIQEQILASESQTIS